MEDEDEEDIFCVDGGEEKRPFYSKVCAPKIEKSFKAILGWAVVGAIKSVEKEEGSVADHNIYYVH